MTEQRELTGEMSEVTDHPAAIDDGLPRQLDRRHVTLERITGWIFTSVLTVAGLIALLIVLFVSGPSVGKAIALVSGWIALFAGFGALSHFWPAAAWRHASWSLDARGLEIRRGVLWREVVHVPRTRVQHTDVSQGPIERRFGLATLIVHTAGTHHASVGLSGLPHETAMQIRDHLVAAGRGDAV